MGARNLYRACEIPAFSAGIGWLTADRRMEKASMVEALSLQEGLNSSVMYVGTGWVWFVNAP